MIWFGPKLARGERILFRHPDGRRDGLVMLTMLAFIFLSPALVYAYRGSPAEILLLLIWPTYFLLAALFHGWRYRAGAWRLMVTDRRLLARPGRNQRAIVTVPREGIEEIRRDGVVFSYQFYRFLLRR